ncbi:MAG: DNA-binding protein [Gammaproteobacteria bacterium]|nr:MAG: DNA-binding protein [Gammaproteobacteria bacterium]
MARLGVTYQDIANAANQLVGQGERPTIELIRRLLGTGSSTTIGNHLRQWRAEQDEKTTVAGKEQLPSELMAVIKGLWDRLVQHSNEKIGAAENQFLQEKQTLQEEFDQVKQTYHQLQQQYEQLKQEKISLSADKNALETALTKEIKEHAALKSGYEGLSKQLNEKSERIDELTRLHKQTQANLEHYRESTREQRLLDQQQHEEQKQALQSELKEVKMQSSVTAEKMLASQQENAQLQQVNTVLQNKYTQLTSQFEKSEQEKNKYAEKMEHWQKKAEHQSNHLTELQTETKLLAQQLTLTKHTLEELKEENKQLAHEKWALAQEKAQLIGQLKQMQVMEKNLTV